MRLCKPRACLVKACYFPVPESCCGQSTLLQSLVNTGAGGARGSRGVRPSPRVPPCSRAACGLKPAVVQVQQRRSRDRERGWLTAGEDTRAEHKTGINDAVKVPKKAVVPFRVPAVPGIQQCRPILTECTTLHFKHTDFLTI